MQNWLGITGPHKHTRLRNIILRAFTSAIVRQWEPRIRDIYHGLLDRAKGLSDTPDLKTDLADHLPATVICHMLGLSADMHDQFRAWTDGLIAGVDKTGPALIEGVATVQAAYEQMHEFLMPIINERRQRPGDDLASLLTQAEWEGQYLDDDEMLGMSVFLFIAGDDTTVNLLTNGMMLLLSHREQLALLTVDHTVMPTLIEECLRHESSITFLGRVAAEDLVVRDHRIEARQILMLMMNAANRDPAQFPNLDRFDVIRSNNKQAAFGWGIHICLGAPLARCEASSVFDVLFKHSPEIKLIHETPTWRPNLTIRMLDSLPVQLRQRLVVRTRNLGCSQVPARRIRSTPKPIVPPRPSGPYKGTTRRPFVATVWHKLVGGNVILTPYHYG